MKDVPEMNAASLICSAVVLEPKASFYEWLEQIARTRNCNASDIYFPEELPVWLIPPLPRFGSQDALDELVCLLKPQLLKATLSGFVYRADQLPSLDEGTFDSFFEMKVRDRVRNAMELLV